MKNMKNIQISMWATVDAYRRDNQGKDPIKIYLNEVDCYQLRRELNSSTHGNNDTFAGIPFEIDNTVKINTIKTI